MKFKNCCYIKQNNKQTEKLKRQKISFFVMYDITNNTILHNVVRVPTDPFLDQKADTNGLRLRVQRYQSKNYVENYIASFFKVLDTSRTESEFVIVAGGDGRYYNDQCLQKIIQMSAANSKVKKLIIGQNGHMITPAISYAITKYKAVAGIILSAGPLSGGPDAQFGIKFNTSNGGTMPKQFTDKVYQVCRKINEYFTCSSIKCSLAHVAGYVFKIKDNNGHTRKFYVEIIDSVEDYCELMKTFFDFKMLRTLIKSGARIVVNTMNGVAGLYVKRILCTELGLPDFEIVKWEACEDFGGLIPEPNLISADDIVKLLRRGVHEIGCVISGDGSSYMVVGKNGYIVQASDAVAIIANFLHQFNYFKKNTIRGYARKLTTSRALDRVAKEYDKRCYEVGSDWKYFSNLFEAESISFCGDEFFYVCTEHVRERDGLWAILAWLTILEIRRTTVPRLLRYHWNKFGRFFYARYEFHRCDLYTCRVLMETLEKKVNDPAIIGKTFNVQKMFKILPVAPTRDSNGVLHHKLGVDYEIIDRQSFTSRYQQSKLENQKKSQTPPNQLIENDENRDDNKNAIPPAQQQSKFLKIITPLPPLNNM